MAEGEEDMPRDAKIVKSLLKSMSIEEYEPRVVHQFLELWYQYVVDVLTDAQLYSEHAGKTTIDCDDIKLATESKVNFSFSQPPPREKQEQDSTAKSMAGQGIPLPPEKDTLISPNYQLAITRKQPAPAVEEMENEEIAKPNPPQEQRTELPQQTPQRVSFAFRPKSQR
ncbi:Transcription initiation factor TAFII31 [Dillenia turbinata]|uniref:Transcription initiation factor TAFII31 n=1 Tax=Dillenia turbinata TaxID=194707 RepID=A0AAN8U7S9_9MAGN